MATKTRKNPLPPYVSYSSFKNFITRLGESTVPSRIDKSVMSNLSGSTQYALLPALHWLGLIDSDGTPDDTLKVLALANDENFGTLLEPIIREKYDFLFAGDLDLESATSEQVVEAFKTQEVTGSTVTKCISFFLRIAKEARIQISPHVKPPPVRRKSSGTKGQKAAAEPVNDGKKGADKDSSPSNMREFSIPIRGLPDGRVLLPKELNEKDATKALRIIKFNLEQYYEIEINEQ